MMMVTAATVDAGTVTVNVTRLCNPPVVLQPSPPSVAAAAAVAVVTAEVSTHPPGNRSRSRTLSSAAAVDWLFTVRQPGASTFTYAGYAAAAGRSGAGQHRRRAVADGPVALEQMRFPSAKFGENVKLDQQHATRPEFGGAVTVGPFGIGLSVGDAGLRFIGAAEAAVMWNSVPAELALDLASNPYEWDVIAKKVKRPCNNNNNYTVGRGWG